MTYIHELKDWPKLYWDDSLLAPKLAAARHAQGLHLGKMQSLGFDLQQEATLKALTGDVVESSAIEGENLNSDEVRSSIARRLGVDAGGLPEPSRHVDGIVEMMLDATHNYDEKLTPERLFSWHGALFPTSRSGLRLIKVGEWRDDSDGEMQVVSGAIGRERVHFEAPPAKHLKKEMNRFLKWFNSKPKTDPVLMAGVAHLWFVTIHPFEDGNGRIARALTDMVLARSESSPTRFYSLSSAIAARRNEYYKLLEKTQKGDLNITGWLEWFLDCFENAIADAEVMLSGVLHKARIWQMLNEKPVNERQQLIINRLLGDWQGNLTTAKYAMIAKCSDDTAQRDIRILVERGVLIKNPARGRSTSYRLAE